MNHKDWSFRKRTKSFGCAFHGIGRMMVSQPNAWIHAAAGIVAIALSLYFGIKPVEWMLVVFAIGFVFAAELFNTAIEQLTDMISPEYDKRAGLVKDMAAGAVLIAAITALIIGMIIFIPYICEMKVFAQ